MKYTFQMSETAESVTSTDLIHATSRVMSLVTDHGKSVEVTYHGVPRAIIVPVPSSQIATSSNPVERAIAQGRATTPRRLRLPRRSGPLTGDSGLTVEDLLAETRAERS
jgi:antitoxin (DNA-binding transcriptional repressor) of toxin-antitoxin stability system